MVGSWLQPPGSRPSHIARSHPAGLPRTVEGLDALPGVGAYTAGAVACFAYGDPVPFADTNIRRVLGRVFLGRVATEREAVELDRVHLPRRAAARWHSALMDLGATVCTARTPRCPRCPLRLVCVFEPAAPGTAVPEMLVPGMAVRAAAKGKSFAASDRRVRGRIISALAAEPAGLTPAALMRAVGDDRSMLLDALIAEGLVERRGRRVRLPG